MKTLITKEKKSENINIQFGVVLENKASLLTQGRCGLGYEGFNNRHYQHFIPPKK
ncbi:MAG TPA: hypothetical protein PLY23_06560 [Alphaproteobacteria bacterium]|nr:hypothetical protein [Alphaproteobacteria bacterium]HQS94344.1 hypothetical protein [Alphaproteobacteria bacterium]